MTDHAHIEDASPATPPVAAGISPTLPDAASAKPGRKVLFTAVKNEGPFLLEWIAYHQAIGFDRILIFYNDCDDGTAELLAALDAAGVVEAHAHSPAEGIAPQGNAARLANEMQLFANGDWVIWLDADEFLNVHVGEGKVDDLIAALGDRLGILIPWRLFGDGGVDDFGGRFLSDRFVMAGRAVAEKPPEIKTFFRMGKHIKGLSATVHRPVLTPQPGIGPTDFLGGNGKPLLPDTGLNVRWIRGQEFGQTRKIHPDEFGWDLAQINHYLVRTPSLYLMKKLRGDGWRPGWESGRLTEEFYRKSNRNEVEDRTILRHLAAVEERLAVLRGVAGVAELTALIARRLAERLERQKDDARAFRDALLEQEQDQVNSAAEINQSASAISPEAVQRAKPGRKILFSAMKNEGPFVLEWIAYHKAIGFDEIVICSNPSDDGMEEILAALAEVGEIRHLSVTVPVGESPQSVASAAFARQVGYRNGDWYIWLDADEFLNIHVGNRTVDALIDAVGTKQCLMVNWRVFGSNGYKRFPGRFISPAFVGASSFRFPFNLEVKSLFRYSEAVQGFGTRHVSRPVMSGSPALAVEDVLVGTGRTGDPENKDHGLWLAGGESAEPWVVPRKDFGWELAQVNHYIVRTPEFFVLKKNRGRGFAPFNPGMPNKRHTLDFFEKHDRNERQDRSILHWQDAVTDQIDRLLGYPTVAAAKQNSDKLVKMRVEAALQEPGEWESFLKPDADFELTFPDVEAAFVKDHYARATRILEYGSGGSTVLAARNGARVVAVESDLDWATRLSRSLLAISGKAHIHHVDIGPTKEWGFPRAADLHERFHRYALSVWDRPDLGDPDVVLIDGRFRAACLVAVMLRARRPTTVLFDDYTERKYYHAVEKLARKEETVGRMARFTVTPGPIPPEMLTQVIGWFQDAR